MRLLKVYRLGWRRSKDAARKTTDLNLDGKGKAYGRRNGEGSWNKETESVCGEVPYPQMKNMRWVSLNKGPLICLRVKAWSSHIRLDINSSHKCSLHVKV